MLRLLLVLFENINDTELDIVVAADRAKLEDSENLKDSANPEVMSVVVGRLELELVFIDERVLVVSLSSMVVVENESVLDQLKILVAPSVVM